MDSKEKQNWARTGLSIIIQVVFMALGMVISVSWALGKYETKFAHEIEEREELTESIKVLSASDAAQNSVLASQVEEVSRLADDILAADYRHTRELDKFEEQITKRLDLIIKLVENQN